MIPGGEPYVDAPDGDGGYHGPDGTWHSHTYIWTSTTMIWTGEATRFELSQTSPPSTFSEIEDGGVDFGTVTCSPNPAPIPAYVTIADVNGNFPVSAGSEDALTLTGNNVIISGASTFGTQTAAEEFNDYVTLGKPLTLSQNAYYYTNHGMLWPILLPVIPAGFLSAVDGGCSGSAEDFSVSLQLTRTLADGAAGSASTQDVLTLPIASGQLQP